MTNAIYYVPEAYSIGGPKLMGRNAAGESFLRGYFKFSEPRDCFWAYLEKEEDAAGFSATAANYGRTEQVRSFTKHDLHMAKEAGVAFLPGPGLAPEAYKRRLYGDASWSLCGITHTTSSAQAMDLISELITSPVQPWDAVICPSNAVKKNVEIVLQQHVNYLKERLGITRVVMPLFPVIPLGVHAEDFQFSQSERNDSRLRLGVSNGDIVVLYAGRLSFHAKSHPLQMYQALELCANETSRKIVLVECGWHANEFIRNAYQEAAKSACPSVKVVLLDGREAENRRIAWSSADIFCSLPDNIQETFGIVPIEAMAAGLPVVVSDWDGYKDTVRDGIDGVRVPMVMPGPGLGADLSHRHALGIDTYDMYCGLSSTFIAADSLKLVEAFRELISSEERRKQMGEAGRKHVEENFDWKHIIPQYENLWNKQNEIRKNHRNKVASLSAGENISDLEEGIWPARLDPTFAFGHYATHQLSEDSWLIWLYKSREECIRKIEQFRGLEMVKFAEQVLPTSEEIEIILEQALLAENKRVKVNTLISGIQSDRKLHVMRGLSWMIKLGIFSFL